jgi:BNR/Asp-box repeat
MDEPRDDIDTWLQERVTPLLPHPGAFEQIKRRARRRKLGRAALASAGAVVVLAGAITVPRLILSGGTGGAPTALSSSSTPVQRSSPSPAGSAQTSTSGPDAASSTPTPPSQPAVPPNFAASSVTFVSTTTGWVIGQAGTPGHCGPPNPDLCTSVAATDDGGLTWHGVPAPITGAPDGGTGVSQIRSLDGVSGWAFGPQLYATHDGGQNWKPVPTHGMRVTDLETVNGIAFAVWARCAGPGADFAADCTTFSLYSSAAGSDDWSPVPGVTGLQASGGAPASAQLVLTGTRGYLMTPGGQLFSGPVSRPTHWRTVTTLLGVPAALPCAPGAAETGGHPLQAMLASTGPGLVLLCASQATGNRQAKTLYYSADGGRSWSPAGPAPARGIAMSLSGTPSGPVLVATSSGIDVSANAPGASGALTWRTARGATAAGGYSYVGMTTSDQGVAVPADLNLDAVWFTYDGGAHWVESPVR